jgi:hypothetical protein
MNQLTVARDRLHRDTGLPALLDAACQAFELLLSALEHHQDPASGMFSHFVQAAMRAADARDAVLFAPSLPTRPLCPDQAAEDVNGARSPADVLDLVALSKVLYQTLDHAAASGIGQADLAACRQAAGYAAAIHQLLTGAGP